jgi:hypothetical protein
LTRIASATTRAGTPRSPRARCAQGEHRHGPGITRAGSEHECGRAIGVSEAGPAGNNLREMRKWLTTAMAEVAVPRQMFQEILLPITQLREPPAPAYQEIRADAPDDDGRGAPRCGQSNTFQRVGAVNWRFDRLPCTRHAIWRCSRCPKGRSWPHTHPESGECRITGFWTAPHAP